MRSQLIVLGVAVFVGHGGQPLDPDVNGRRGAGHPAPHGAVDADAGRFLAAARGVDPVICSLAATPMGNHWGSDAPVTTGEAETALLEWALKPSLDDRDLTVLEAGLHDPDGCVRAMAARLLASAEQGVRILTQALGDEQSDTRRVAAEGLGYAESATAVTPLIRRLQDDDVAVRIAAAWALGRIEDPSATEPLIAMLTDQDARARAAAARALGEMN